MIEPMTATLLLARIKDANFQTREELFLDAYAQRQVPQHLLELVPIPVSNSAHRGTIYVMPDYLGIGTNEDWLRTPLLPTTAQAALDVFDMVLPTRKVVNILWTMMQAHGRVPFTSFVPKRGESRDSTRLYVASHKACIEAIGAMTGPFVGHKKEIVITSGIAKNPKRLAIYGAWYEGQWPLQGYPTRHNTGYVDYSHGVRGVSRTMEVDGNPMAIEEVLQNAALCSMISDEGVISESRYQR